MIHLLGLGRDGVQPLLQQADAGGEILGGKLAGQRLEGVLEVVEEPRVVGPHAGQLAIGGMHAGHHHHLVEGVILILLVRLPEELRLHAVIVQGEGLLQRAKLGGGLGAVLIDEIDAVVEPGPYVGVQGLQRLGEGGIEQLHLVLARCQGLIIRRQLKVLVLTARRLPLPAHLDLAGMSCGREGQSEQQRGDWLHGGVSCRG